MKLLTPAHANTKTAKNETMGNFQSYILHLAPYKLSGKNVCPMASRGCAAACLNTAGRGRFDSIQDARIKKTKRFHADKAGFMADLVKDLEAVVRKAKRDGMRPVVRLNGTSDVDWTFIKTDNGQNVFERFNTIQFYDYTKVLRRLVSMQTKPIPNYDLTFSKSESNDAEALRAIALGFNVAAVFSIKDASQLPSEFNGRPVIDGDSHDLRFLDAKPSDGQGAFIGLKAKGDAKKDKTGFVIQIGVA
jgi:hypothetical protein